MENKIYPICYNKEHYAVVSNDIIQGKQDMTLHQARLLRLMITQVVKEDKDLKTYSCRIQDLAKFLNIDSSNLYRDVQKFCSDLLKLQVKVGSKNPKKSWAIFQWFQLAKYDDNGTLTLMLSNQIAPFVLDLNKWFTQYKLENILEMNSFYSIRLYELLKCQMGINQYDIDFSFSLEELRVFFCCENKYKQFGDFKKNVIHTAITEINEKTDLFVFVTYEKFNSRSFNKINFEIHMQNKKRVQGITPLPCQD